jgi:hypothetical protein
MRHLKTIWLFAIIAACVFQACKEPEGIGLDVLPNGEQMPIAWVDTFTLEARTVRFDSVRTSNRGTYVVGDFGDPIFGRVRSQLYTQFKLQAEPAPDAFDEGTVDSIVLNLAYSGSYGRRDKLRGAQQFSVYELETDLDEDSVYYSDDMVTGISMTALADTFFTPDLLNSYNVWPDEEIPPSFRIRLPNSFGQRILGSDSLTTNDQFSGAFKGLNIRPDNPIMPSDQGSLLYFNIGSSFSRIELYYHTAEEDSIRYEFKINNDNAAHTSVEHEFSQELIDAMDTNQNIGDQTLYVQSLAGTRIRVEFPFLRNMNDLGVVAINRAELLLPVDVTREDDFSLPPILIANRINAGDSAFAIVDQFEPEGINYYDGTYDDENDQYVFVITRYLQQLLSEPDIADYGLYLSSLDAVDAKRGVFNGPQHPDRPLKLRMTYTIVE